MTGRPRKYRNVPTVLDGIRFDSKAEARYYAELKLREKAGEIAELTLQPVYVLSVKPKVTYRADFRFHDLRAATVRVVDVKGRDTEASRTRRAWVKQLHGVDVEVVK